MLGGPARQTGGSVARLAQLPSGAIVSINDYQLVGETAELADVFHLGGYMHGRWTHGQARLGRYIRHIGGDAGECHYAVVEHSAALLRRHTALGCQGIFTSPTVAGGRGPIGQAHGSLDMVWQDGTLRLVGSVEVRVNGAQAALPIRHYQPAIGVASQGGSPFGGNTYTLTPVVAETGMLRCVILYKLRLDLGVFYQGVGMFEAHTRV